ncbi:hypothetical protein PMIN06_001839 [Paraphaeosphaeria minitans]|uniref:Conserved oligomeric Golgi complex subunit 2 n=1 Tax=Paraphaeosphaeria minitans TaxID=565426 RepID=A0A9P6KSC1_9PLEO|nr:hypothetical protein PMIN01_04859 [Paraphaeosphaeria minitans]
MSRFYIDDSSSPASPTHPNSDSASDSETDTLPYPAPLSRASFLSPTFTPQSYLSTLSNRHQTLEDLRSDLRARSALLSRELLDLVNTHYTDFLTLGASLRGGDEKVEEVRVGLLGFGKEVGALAEGVGEREAEVAELVKERERIRRGVVVGRRLMGFEEGLKGLEEGLGIVEVPASDSEGEEEADEYDDEDEDEDEDEGVVGGVSLAKLSRHVLQWRVVQEAEKGLAEHPFVVAQASRMAKVRGTLLLDLSAALRQAKAAGAKGRVIKIMRVYADMGEAGEAVNVLKELKA